MKLAGKYLKQTAVIINNVTCWGCQAKNTILWKSTLPPTTSQVIKRKHRLFTRYQTRNDRGAEKKYNKVRNQVRKETRARTANKQHNIAKYVLKTKSILEIYKQ